MSMASKNVHSEARSIRPGDESSYYSPDGPVVEFIGDIENEVNLRPAPENGSIAERADEFANRMGDRFDRASEAVQGAARRTSARAQKGARSTAQAAREHPVIASAIVGCLATAAMAGVGLYRVTRRDGLLVEPVAPRAKKVVQAVKQAAKRKR